MKRKLPPSQLFLEGLIHVLVHLCVVSHLAYKSFRCFKVMYGLKGKFTAFISSLIYVVNEETDTTPVL